MEINHDNNEGPLGVVFCLIGIICFAVSHAEASDIRAWTAFALGASASILSIIINWDKFVTKIKNVFKKKL